MFVDPRWVDRAERIDNCVEEIRRRFGKRQSTLQPLWVISKCPAMVVTWFGCRAHLHGSSLTRAIIPVIITLIGVKSVICVIRQ